jgi:hypothetical protein
MSLADRRRITFAMILTLIALPVIWAIGRAESSDGPAATDTVPVAEADAAADGTYIPEPPVFLDGEAPLPPPAVIAVDRPPSTDGRGFDGRATFQRLGTAANTSCSTALAPSGATLTVTNIDNGLQVTCYNGAAVTPPAGTDLVVHTDLLARICDLADAPVPVRVSW